MTPSQDTNLYQLVAALESFATSHPQITSFAAGPLDELDINKLGAQSYPLFFVTPGDTLIDEGTARMTLDLVVADLQPADLQHRVATMNDTLYLLRDVVTFLKQHDYDDSFRPRAVLQLPVICTPFMARFDAALTGWTATVEIELDNANDLCLLP